MESEDDISNMPCDDELEKVLKGLFEKHGHYYGLGETGNKYKEPTTRYEAWLIMSALSNYLLYKQVKLLNESLSNIKRVNKKKVKDKERRRRR